MNRSIPATERQSRFLRFLRPGFVFTLFIGLFACVSTQLVHAQTEPPKPATLRFLFIDESAGHYSLKLGSDHFIVSANPYEISAPFTPTGIKPLDIYKTFPAELDTVTGKPKRVKIAMVTPPRDTPSALIIVTPRPPAVPGAELDYKVEVIDGNPSLFPPGSIRIINRSPVPMAAQFSEKRVLTGPGEINLVQPVADSRHRILFKIAIQIQEEAGGWKIIQDSITAMRPKDRMVGILVYSPGGMRHMLTPAEIAEFGPPKPGCFWLTYSDRP